jgi:hypothetical protein
MAVSCPPKVAVEDTQNKAQFGWRPLSTACDLTASGISQHEIGHWPAMEFMRRLASMPAENATANETNAT